MVLLVSYIASADNPSDDPTQGKDVRKPVERPAAWLLAAEQGNFAVLDSTLADLGSHLWISRVFRLPLSSWKLKDLHLPILTTALLRAPSQRPFLWKVQATLRPANNMIPINWEDTRLPHSDIGLRSEPVGEGLASALPAQRGSLSCLQASLSCMPLLKASLTLPSSLPAPWTCTQAGEE